MAHLVLLGDSTFDNGAYVGDGPEVISQVRTRLPAGWRATLRAADGAATADVAGQLAALPPDAERLVVSVGGNDALACAHLLDAPARNCAEALGMIGEAARGFEAAYRAMLKLCLRVDRDAAICTIYSGSFPDPDFQRVARVALAPFNDAIIRAGVEHGLTIVDLRLVCDAPADYANAIEPSAIGGAKIAAAVARAATGDGGAGRTARIIA